MKTKNWLCAALIGLGFFWLASCSLQKDSNRYVVVLSMDGFRADYPEKAHTPTLDSLARVGVRAALRPSFPSVTFPNHYTLATGLYPDHHGLVNNSFYAPDLGKVYHIGDSKSVSDPAFYGGEPIWNTAEKQGVKAATFFWVGSEAPIQNMRPSIWKHFDKRVSFKARADSVVAWLKLPAKERPHLILWYMEEPDATGHACGPDSSATLHCVERMDSVLAYFFGKARQLAIFKQIDFLIVSDHGMATYYPQNYVNLNDYLPRDSFDYVFDGVPTFLYPKPGYEQTAWEILQKVPRVKAYKKEDLPADYHYGKNPRIGGLVVVPQIGTYLQFRPESHPRKGGAHGYDNFTPQMQAIFYAAGPSFRKGFYLHKPLPNVDIYSLIARLLTLKPAPNDGNAHDTDSLLKR
jgi:predicted AlkP superfamily pyrophosphatase or phosphodiesterase